jgi:hypothetical protein
VTWLVVLVVLTQRLGVPVGGTPISVAIPLTYLAVGLLLIRRRLEVSQLRFELLLLGLTACVATTAAVALRGGTFSSSSLMLLVAIYLPWVFSAGGGAGRDVLEHAGAVFIRVMLVLATCAVAQFIGQLAGVWQYEDVLLRFVPSQLVVPNYNPSIPLEYGAEIYKANAFVMLEPSFLSQYCALAVLVGLVTRIRSWQLVVLIAGLASAVSGTGIVLLISGIVLLLVRERQRIRPAYVIAGAVALTLVLLSPAASLLLQRSDEVSASGSSGNARFVTPYTIALGLLHDDPYLYATGAGPGMAYDVVGSVGPLDANFTILPKLVLEYGLIAGGVFMLFIVFSLLDGVAWRVVPGALVIALFLLSGALLQPQTATLAWLLTGLGSARSPWPAAGASQPRRPVPAVTAS